MTDKSRSTLVHLLITRGRGLESKTSGQGLHEVRAVLACILYISIALLVSVQCMIFNIHSNTASGDISHIHNIHSHGGLANVMRSRQRNCARLALETGEKQRRNE